MLRMKLNAKTILLTGAISLMPIVSYGQQVGGDLGSSSGLFKGKSSSTKSAPKTATPAPKTTAPKKKPAAKKVAIAPKPNPPARRTPSRRGSGNTATAVNTEERVFNATAANKPVSAQVEAQFEDLIEAGNLARDDRNYAGAETAYRNANKLKARDSRSVYGMGNLYSDLQRWEEAEKVYRQAIEFEPNEPEAYIALSFVLTQPIAGANVADRYVEAEKLTRKALSIDRNNAIAYDQLGNAMELQGKIGRETEDAYRKASELAPTYALPHAHLGRLLGRNNKAADSRVASQKAISLATDAPSMILVAETLQVSRIADAEALLRRALHLDPKNPMALFMLSDVLSRQQRMADAEKVLRDSIQISQNSYTPHSKLGDLFLQQRRFEEAEASFLRALPAASPTEKIKLAGLQGFTGVGDGFMQSKKHREAVRAYAKAKQIDPQNTEISAKLSSAERVAN